MLLLRSVKESVYRQVTSLFNSPPAGTFDSAFTVLGEDLFVSDPSPEEIAVYFPYVWLMQIRVEPRPTRLPMILMEIPSPVEDVYEAGNAEGTAVEFFFHIFGRNRGERDDLAWFLYRYFRLLDIYDFKTNTKLFTAQVQGRQIREMSIGQDLGIEGTLTNWSIVSGAILIRE